MTSIFNFEIFPKQCNAVKRSEQQAHLTRSVIYKVYDKFIIGGNKRRRFCGRKRQSSSGEKKGPFLRSSSKAHPEQAIQRVGPPRPRRPQQPRSPDGACSPISRSVSRPRFRSGRGRERRRRERHASAGLMRRQRPIERTAVVVVLRPPRDVLRRPPAPPREAAAILWLRLL